MCKLAESKVLLSKGRSIFNRKGAYARFKSLLEGAGKVEKWYTFEAKHTEQAVL